MKSSVASVALITGIVAICVFCGCLLLGKAWVFSETVEIDINSGDTRHQIRVCSVKTKDEIEQSLLSREAARLAIDIPTTRQWKSGGMRLIGGSRSAAYGITIGAGDQLVKLLVETNAPLAERRDVLERFLAILRTGTPHEIDRELYLLSEEVRALGGVSPQINN